jgi:hypothetical protein
MKAASQGKMLPLYYRVYRFRFYVNFCYKILLYQNLNQIYNNLNSDHLFMVCIYIIVYSCFVKNYSDIILVNNPSFL